LYLILEFEQRTYSFSCIDMSHDRIEEKTEFFRLFQETGRIAEDKKKSPSKNGSSRGIWLRSRFALFD